MTSANGNLLFFRSDEVAGMAFRVERMYFGETLACGEGVTEDFPNCQRNPLREHEMLTLAGRMIGGGG
jgi:hypothetical protein